MNLLAIDTATEACSVAVSIDGVRDEIFEVPGRGHTAVLPTAIATLQARTPWQWTDLDCLVVGCGPGAFTGVRIGLAYVQGLARGLGIPVVPVSSLAAMAWQAGAQAVAEAVAEVGTGHVATAIDARAGGVYYALYALAADAPPMPVVAERVCPPEAVPPLLADQRDGLITAGTGWQSYAAELSAALGAELPDSGVRLPHAGAMLDIALAGAPAAPIDTLEPTYLRDQVVHRAS